MCERKENSNFSKGGIGYVSYSARPHYIIALTLLDKNGKREFLATRETPLLGEYEYSRVDVYIADLKASTSGDYKYYGDFLEELFSTMICENVLDENGIWIPMLEDMVLMALTDSYDMASGEEEALARHIRAYLLDSGFDVYNAESMSLSMLYNLSFCDDAEFACVRDTMPMWNHVALEDIPDDACAEKYHTDEATISLYRDILHERCEEDIVMEFTFTRSFDDGELYRYNKVTVMD